MELDHKDENNDVNFEMIMTGTFNEPLERIIDESIRIKNKESKSILNFKSECHGTCLKRIVLEESDCKCEICDLKAYGKCSRRKTFTAASNVDTNPNST